MSFSMLKTKKLIKSCVTVVEVHHYELGGINLYLEGTPISASIIASLMIYMPHIPTK